ncbi:hypothetical protein CAPTEDRAFT_195459, partial [Capitella teleta]
MGVRLRPIALLFSVSLVLTGCVTTDGRPVNENRAVVDYINLAKGYLQEGYSERAVRPLERALEIEPDSASVHGMLGMAYQRQGEDRLAQKAFNRALSIDPEASEVRNNFGAFLFSKNRLKESYQQFELASQDVSYSQRSRTFENMGIVALRLGQSELAVEHFTRALRLNSNLPRANLELATIYKNEGNLYKGWQHYQAFDEAAEQSARSLLLGIELAAANGAQKSLKITESYVRAIEESTFDVLPQAAFVRGYIRNYARLVGINGEDLGAQKVKPLRAHSTPSPAHALALLLVVSLGGLSYYLWNHLLDAEPAAEVSIIEEVSEQIPESLVNVESIPPVTGGEVETSIVEDTASSDLSAVVEEESEQVEERPEFPPIAVDSAEVVDVTADDDAKPVPGFGKPLVIDFSQDCWVEIKDATGEVLVSAVQKAGSSINLSVFPP